MLKEGCVDLWGKEKKGGGSGFSEINSGRLLAEAPCALEKPGSSIPRMQGRWFVKIDVCNRHCHLIGGYLHGELCQLRDFLY